MMNQTWLDDEPGVLASVRQGAELLCAGLRRGWLMSLCAVLLALLITGALLYKKHDYAPRFVFRVVEADRDPRSMPRMKSQLGEYVRQAIFTSQPLFAVIRRHGLYPKLMRQNSRAALDSFREDISVDVYQNYFVQTRGSGGMPRSARVAVSYRSTDRETALAVTRDLGALIIARESAARRAQALEASAAAELERDSAVQAVHERSQQVLTTEARLQQSSAPDPKLQVELVALLGSLDALERRAAAAERRADTLDLSAAFERRGIGMHFELVDDASLPSDRQQLHTRLWLACCSFVLSLPLLGMGIGAFDAKREVT